MLNQTRIFPILRIVNPATGALLREIEEDAPDTIREKFARAEAAQKSWAAEPLERRLAVIRRFRELIVERTEVLAAQLTDEVGKPIAQSRNELNGLLPRLDFFLTEAAGVLARETVFTDPAQKLVEQISHEPLGVILNISAWNYPFFVGANVFVPALLAGNAVLYKPSEFATLTGIAIAALLHEAGIPEDAFIPVIGGGSVGAGLMELPAAAVFFTGSYATGSKVAEAAARTLMKVQLELGGKDAVYVCDDVNVEAAAAAVADGAFYNNGQSCCAVERIYVHERIAGQFEKAFLDTVNGFVLGDPADGKTYLGAVTRKAHLNALDRQVKDAVAKGAQLRCGGHVIDRPGNYYAPTVLTEVNHGMDVMREETFGPIIGIQVVKNDDEAAGLMNDTPYGLTAGVYTVNQERAGKILSQVRTGSVYWNCCDRVSPRLPWSGRGHSGMGVTLGKAGILAFTQPKAWHLKS